MFRFSQQTTLLGKSQIESKKYPPSPSLSYRCNNVNLMGPGPIASD